MDNFPFSQRGRHYNLAVFAQALVTVLRGTDRLSNYRRFDERRVVIQEVKKSRNADVASVKKRVLDELDKEDIYIALIGLPNELCRGLNHDEALRVLEDWLKTKRRFKKGAVRGVEDVEPFILRIPRNTYLQLTRISKNPADLIKEVLVVRLRETCRTE